MGARSAGSYYHSATSLCRRLHDSRILGLALLTMYIIKRIEKDGGGYVAKDGSEHSYTYDITKAKTFKTLEAAELNCCPDNEIILRID